MIDLACAPPSSLCDDIISGAIGGAAASIIAASVFWLNKWILECVHKKRVYKWIHDEKIRRDKDRDLTSWTWRSATAISRHTNLTTERVRFICSIHKKIVPMIGQNQEKDLWKIKE